MDKIKLRDNLQAFFNDAELRALCFEFDIDYENLKGGEKSEKVMELITFFERRERLTELQMRLSELRPKIIWQGEANPMNFELNIKGADGKAEILLDRESPASHISWKPNVADVLAVVLRNKEILILNTSEKKGEILPKAHEHFVTCVKWSRDGNYLATGSSDMTIQLWETSTVPKHSAELIGTAGGVLDLAWSPEGTMLVSAGEDRCLRYWNVASSALKEVSKALNSWVPHVEWGQTGNKIVTSSEDGEIQIWEPISKSPHLRINTNNRTVNSLAISPDERILAVSFKNGSLDIYDAETGEKIIPLDAEDTEVDFLLFSKDGKRLIGTSPNQRAMVWRVDSWQPSQLKSFENSANNPEAIFSAAQVENDTVNLAFIPNENPYTLLIHKFEVTDVKQKRKVKPDAIPLSADEIREVQTQFPDWDINENGMSRLYTFSDFMTAMKFMQKCAPIIDEEDHHPEWTNIFNRVKVTYSTLVIGKKLTKRDLQAAQILDQIFEQGN